MKNLTRIFTAIAVLLVSYSCVTDVTETPEVSVGAGVGQTSLTLSLGEGEVSRIYLGDRTVDGEEVASYQLLWSEGDAIAVNGQASNPLTEVRGAEATFTFGQDIVTPYHIVYPAPSAVEAEEVVGGEEETPALVYPVEFLAAQQYVPGNIDPKAAPMYGYVPTPAEGETAGTPTLKHLVGVLRFAVKGNGEVLKSLTVKAEDGSIAGIYNVNCETGELAATGEAVKTVTMSFGDGITLGEEATPLYVAVPAGSYGTIMITLVTETDKMSVKFNTDAKPVKAGVVREFVKDIEYLANENDAEGVLEIYTEADLVAFAKSAKAFFPRTKAVVKGNLDMSKITEAEDLALFPIEGFGAYEFDGGSEDGYTISNLTTPLFGSTAANIKNVKLVGVEMEVTTLAHSGAIACGLYGGSLDNCSAAGTININNTTLAEAAGSYAGICHAGLVGYASAATVNNCTNDADITITSVGAPALNTSAAIGGIVGCASDGCAFDNLTNNGDVTYVGETKKGNMYISGVVGKNSDANGQEDFKSINNCTNTGAISTAKGSKSTGDILLSGITGRLEISEATVCDKLVNTGAITHNGECVAFRGAGIVSYYARVSFTNCSNSGDITVTTGAKATSAYLAGIVAATVYTGEIDNCSNSGDMYIGDNIAFAGAVHLVGLMDYVVNDYDLSEPAVVTNCTNTGALYCGNSTNTATSNGGRLYMCGLFGSADQVTMSNCVNEATGTTTAKTGKWASRYMIGGVVAYVGVNNTNCPLTTITDCENKAAIVVEPVDEVNSAQIGGVTCEPYYNQKQEVIQVKYLRVKNSGDITVKGTFTTTDYPYLGGFMGVNNHDYVVMEDCENSGDITFAATAASARVGGLVGNDDNNKYFLMDGCVNKGNIAYDCVATSLVRVGGVIGHRQVGTTTEIKNTVNEGNITVADQTVTSTTEHPYTIAGAVGYNHGKGLTLTNCTNGSSTDSTKGAITVGEAPSGIGLAGMVGISAQALTITGCKNYGTVKQTGIGAQNKTYRAHIAGILGECLVGGINVTGCENCGVVEYGDKPNPTKDARVDVAGIVATTLSSSNVISGCKNSGTVNYKAKKTNAGEVTVAGIVGCPQTGTLIENCENTSTGLVHGAGATTSGYDVGGIGGGPSGSNVIFKGCKNYGEVKQSGALGGAMYIGGICGYGYAVKGYEGCENRGPITIGNTNTKAVYAGGIVGYARIASGNGTTADARYMKNCANYYDLTFTGKGGTYYAGGIAGYIRNDDAEMYWSEISGLKNIANITFNCTASTPAFGGLAGAVNVVAGCPVGALANITNCVSYGNIKAIGFEGKVGMFVGVARTADTYVVTNSQAGGNMIFSTGDTGELDDDMNPIVSDILTPLTAENLGSYLYKTAVDTSVVTADGCSYISAAPAN